VARHSGRNRHRESLRSRKFPVLSLRIREAFPETSWPSTPPTAIRSAVAETLAGGQARSPPLGPYRATLPGRRFGSQPETRTPGRGSSVPGQKSPSTTSAVESRRRQLSTLELVARPFRCRGASSIVTCLTVRSRGRAWFWVQRNPSSACCAPHTSGRSMRLIRSSTERSAGCVPARIRSTMPGE